METTTRALICLVFPKVEGSSDVGRAEWLRGTILDCSLEAQASLPCLKVRLGGPRCERVFGQVTSVREAEACSAMALENSLLRLTNVRTLSFFAPVCTSGRALTLTGGLKEGSELRRSTSMK